jgi:hypothetical protein
MIEVLTQILASCIYNVMFCQLSKTQDIYIQILYILNLFIFLHNMCINFICMIFIVIKTKNNALILNLIYD